MSDISLISNRIFTRFIFSRVQNNKKKKKTKIHISKLHSISLKTYFFLQLKFIGNRTEHALLTELTLITKKMATKEIEKQHIEAQL